MRKLTYALAALFMLLSSACENPYHPDNDGTEPDGGQPAAAANFTIRVSAPEQSDFDESTTAEAASQYRTTRPLLHKQPLRTQRAVGEVCSRLSIAIYTNSGGSYTKVKEIAQQRGDSGFGTASIQLSQGTYTIVAIAHNGDGKPTMTNPEKIPFSGNKVTDTFFCTEEVTVGDDTTADLCLHRAVAMVNFSTTDATPADITKMRFYYTGGSSTFNAISGYGCVNSKQTEERTVDASFHSSASTYDIYTFPRQDSEAIALTVSALDKSGNAIFEYKFNDIPVALNYKTLCHGKFFGEDAGGGRIAPAFTIDDEWSGEHDYPFDTKYGEIE